MMVRGALSIVCMHQGIRQQQAAQQRERGGNDVKARSLPRSARPHAVGRVHTTHVDDSEALSAGALVGGGVGGGDGTDDNTNGIEAKGGGGDGDGAG